VAHLRSGCYRCVFELLCQLPQTRHFGRKRTLRLEVLKDDIIFFDWWCSCELAQTVLATIRIEFDKDADHSGCEGANNKNLHF
jgi:hypothetical protein